MESEISVIIPVYNVEKYLPECLDSVLSQNYSELQIILIDDGSTDDSGMICDDYAAKDSRIAVIHQKNSGAAAAKNAGLRMATGEYLSFVDSDDYLEPGAFRHMVNLLEKYSADVIQCGFCDLFVDEKIDRITLENVCTFTAVEYLKRYTTDWTCGLLWDKLYKRSLFENIFFEEGHIIDDEFFTYRGVMKAKKIVHDPKVVYNYRKRRSSVTIRPEYKERTIFDKMDYLEKRRENIAFKFPELREMFDLHYIDMLIWLSADPYITIDCLKSIKNKISTYMRNNRNEKIGWRRKLKLFRIRYTSPEKMVLKRNIEQISNPGKYFN